MRSNVLHKMSEMPSSISCKNCATAIHLPSAIEAAPYSWPKMSTFWYVCANCGTGNHIKVIKDRMEVLEILGAPGPTWKTVQTALCRGLDTKQDPEFLHVWLGDIHRAIPARE